MMRRGQCADSVIHQDSDAHAAAAMGECILKEEHHVLARPIHEREALGPCE
jgi:hypothetical protein